MISSERRNFGNIVPSYQARPFVDDQAAALRHLTGEKFRGPRVLAITSGKGGVGKTNLAVNLSLALRQLGRRVTLVDLDLGLANVDILLDVTPRYNLASVIAGSRSISEVAVETPEGLRLIPGASGIEKLANLTDGERARLIESFEELHRSTDVIVFDTGAGISKNTTGFLAAADDVVVVTTPEPTAVLDAYAVIKLLSNQADRGQVSLVVNMAADRAEAERFAQGIAGTAYRMLNTYVEKLGYVLADPAVPRAVRMRRPLLSAFPHSAASECVRRLAREILREPLQPAVDVPRVGFVRRMIHALAGRTEPNEVR